MQTLSSEHGQSKARQWNLSYDCLTSSEAKVYLLGKDDESLK